MKYNIEPLKNSMEVELHARIERIWERGISPLLATIRLGENPSDVSYEKMIDKTCERFTVERKKVVLPEDTSEEDVINEIETLQNQNVGGILIFRPLPRHISEEKINGVLDPELDIDGATPENLYKIFTGKRAKVPATAKSALYIARDMEEDLSGKRVVIVNRSLVIGKPLAMTFLNENATVTLAHSRTKDMAALFTEADIIVTGIGKSEFFGRVYFKPHHKVIDCGIAFNEAGKMTGDCAFSELEDYVDLITPVPGGVGAITNLCLLENLLENYDN